MGLASTKINKNVAICVISFQTRELLPSGFLCCWSWLESFPCSILPGQVSSVIRQNLITAIQKLIKFCETSIGNFIFFNVPGANISQHVDEFTLKQRYKNSNAIQGSYANHNFVITCSGLEFFCTNFNIYERFMINDKSLQACYVCCMHTWHGWMFHWAQWWFGEVYEVIW